MQHDARGILAPLLKKNSSTCTTNSVGVLSSLSKRTHIDRICAVALQRISPKASHSAVRPSLPSTFIHRLVETAARQCHMMWVQLGARNDSRLVVGRQPHGLGAIELRVLEGRDPDELRNEWWRMQAKRSMSASGGSLSRVMKRQ